MIPRLSTYLVACLLSAAPLLAADGWLTDFDEAKKIAQKEHKDILVDFTGSDWCGWCIRLKKEVFDQADFTAASKDFVLVELDFPQKKKQPPEMKAKNSALATQFNIEGYPTILLLDAQGEPYAQTGYQEGGAKKYLEHLAELRKSNTPEGKKTLAERKRNEVRGRKLGEEMQMLVDPILEKKDLAAADAAVAKFVKEQALLGELRLSLLVNARINNVVTCQPGNHAMVLKTIDEIIESTKDADLGDLKKFRAQVAAARDAEAAEQAKKK